MPKTVLTVDDSKTMRDMVRFTMENNGYEVSEAEDGVDALKKFAEQPFDVIITDLNMPNMDGFELITEFRKGDTHKYTPILILTTESEPEKKQRGRAAGATGWIVKPFDPEKLTAVVAKVSA